MRIGVKICGITDERALDACIEADVDWIGLVFFARSPRCVTTAKARDLASRLPAAIAPVGLFVEPDDDEIARTLECVTLGAIQLYARAERVASVRDRFGIPVWHACPVSSRTGLPARTDAERLVIEGEARGSDRPGGNAAGLDASLLLGWRSPVPWLLAGGLTPANVGRAIEATDASAVDVSSGVEDRPGSKDPRAIAAFTAAARRAGASVQ